MHVDGELSKFFRSVCQGRGLAPDLFDRVLHHPQHMPKCFKVQFASITYLSSILNDVLTPQCALLALLRWSGYVELTDNIVRIKCYTMTEEKE